MKEIVRYGSILTLICVLAAGLLASVNLLTGPKILAAALAEEMAALKEIMPSAAKFSPVQSGTDKTVLYYRALDKQEKLMGFVFKAQSKGYSSVIETLAGIFLDGKISAIKVISQNETPGLGVRIRENKFQDQFKNKNIFDLSGVQLIVGATVSSRAVTNSVMEKARQIRELVKNDPIDGQRTEGELRYGK